MGGARTGANSTITHYTHIMPQGVPTHRSPRTVALKDGMIATTRTHALAQ